MRQVLWMSVLLGGCASAVPGAHELADTSPPLHPVSEVPAVRDDSSARVYELLTPEAVMLGMVFDDSRDTYLSFRSAVPAGLLIFDEHGRAVSVRRGERSAIVTGVHAGLLLRTATRHSYAQAPPRGVGSAPATVIDASGLPVLDPVLAAARAQILQAEGRLTAVTAQIDRAAHVSDPAALKGAMTELEAIQMSLQGVEVSLLRAHFGSGSASLGLSDHAKSVLLMAATQASQVRVRAGTDNVGDTSANERLARHRATAMRELLVQGGVDPLKVHIGAAYRGYVASNATAEGRAQNRRVDVLLSPSPDVRIPVAQNGVTRLDATAP